MAQYNKVKQNAESVTVPRMYIDTVANNRYLTELTLRVWLLLLTLLDTERYTILDLAQIGRNLMVSEDDVIRSINQLKEEGYLSEGGSSLVYSGYMLRTWE